MNTKKYPPNPARVAIVQDVTQCSEPVARQAVISLDEYDTGIPPNAPETRSSVENGGRYASFPDVLPIGKAALVAAGYGSEEAGRILTQLFIGLAAEHGGKRLYLPKADKITQRVQECL